jgi:peptide/nickel transport system substrate-binding protein
MDWLKNNEAGSGAFRVEKWTPGQELTYQRFDEWKSGPVPKIQRVIWRIVPSAGNRRALIERGDADISFDLPPKDVAEMANDKKLTVVGSLIECAQIYLSMNVKIPPLSTRSRCARRSPTRSLIRRSWMRRCSAAANRCSAGRAR